MGENVDSGNNFIKDTPTITIANVTGIDQSTDWKRTGDQAFGTQDDSAAKKTLLEPTSDLTQTENGDTDRPAVRPADIPSAVEHIPGPSQSIIIITAEPVTLPNVAVKQTPHVTLLPDVPTVEQNPPVTIRAEIRAVEHKPPVAPPAKVSAPPAGHVTPAINPANVVSADEQNPPILHTGIAASEQKPHFVLITDAPQVKHKPHVALIITVPAAESGTAPNEVVATVGQDEDSASNAGQSDTPGVSESEDVAEDPEAACDIADEYVALAELIDKTGKECSYNQGYIKRQQVFACRTCTLDVLEAAGMCLGCALNCHEEHDIIPLLTRRNFRCDCGNTKFGPRKCQLSPGKDKANEKNTYNENFHGTICNCKKALDSNKAEAETDLAQCRVCEEQFHGSHIGVSAEDFGEEWEEELVCPNCLNKHSFLQVYAADFSNPESFSTDAEKTGQCALAELRKNFGFHEQATKGFVFPSKWSEHLCTCQDCKDMYKNSNLEFLLDAEDTYCSYIKREGAKEQANVQRASQLSPDEIFAQICEGFDSVTQVELAHWFNNLREVFVEFLRNRIQERQVITEVDVEEFFAIFNNPEEKDGDAAE